MIILNILSIFIFIFILYWIFPKKFKNYPDFILRFFFGFKLLRNVVDGLIYRELKTRITKTGFGIVGIFIEPVAVMLIFVFIFSLIRAANRTLDTGLFLLSGIVLFTLFNQIAIRSVNAMKANEPLFIYKPIKPIDTVIARTLIEAALYSIVFIFVSVSIFYFKEEFILNDFPLMVVSFICLSLTSFGIGLFLMVLGHYYPLVIQLVPVLIRPLWLMSGIFFSIKDLPSRIIPLLSWNPILQAIELTRHSFSLNYIIDENIVSLKYLISFTFSTLCFGLWIYTKNEKRLLTR